MDLSEPVISVSALTRHFGVKAALAPVSLSLPRLTRPASELF